jgi:hypothetical protein
MGKTAFNGPVYGAKSLLWSHSLATGSTGASTTLIAATVIAPYEDWYVTEVKASFSTGSSAGNSFIFKSEGGSSGLPRYQGQPSTVAQTMATINSGTSTSLNAVTTVTASAGEYEGLYVPAGSTVRVVSSGVNGVSKLNIGIWGFVRFIPSTRAEA